MFPPAFCAVLRTLKLRRHRLKLDVKAKLGRHASCGAAGPDAIRPPQFPPTATGASGTDLSEKPEAMIAREGAWRLITSACFTE